MSVLRPVLAADAASIQGILGVQRHRPWGDGGVHGSGVHHSAARRDSREFQLYRGACGNGNRVLHGVEQGVSPLEAESAAFRVRAGQAELKRFVEPGIRCVLAYRCEAACPMVRLDLLVFPVLDAHLVEETRVFSAAPGSFLRSARLRSR